MKASRGSSVTMISFLVAAYVTALFILVGAFYWRAIRLYDD
jgi:hypothetical protein